MHKNNILNLKNWQTALFSDEEMYPRQNANRDEVLKTFTPLAENIVIKLLEAGDCYLEIAERYPIARQENTFPSSVLHGLIVEKLSNVEGVRLTKYGKRNSFINIGSYMVWVKKLDDNYLPWVNETKSSVRRVYQKAEGEDVQPVLILGYRLDQIERISQIQLVYIEGDRHIWAPINLGDIAASSHIVPNEASKSDEPAVKVKVGKERHREKIE